MSENLKKFLDLIASNKELEAKALACNELGKEKGKEAMLALAKECGIELTLADLEEKEEPASCELDDDELDAVVGGYEAGQKVRCNRWSVDYCPKCGKLLLNYEATITGVRGEIDGKTLYWITRDCCGYKTSVIETAIVC